jgi:ABC-type transport system substrate-binding protein
MLTFLGIGSLIFLFLCLRFVSLYSKKVTFAMQPLNYLFFFILLLSSCSKIERQVSGSLVFKYNESKGIPTLDPAYARSLPVIWPINQLFNGLVQLNDSLQVKPCISKEWTISNDGKTYTFQLRSDVFFHDSQVFSEGQGRRVVASDFIFSFNRIVNPSTASPGAWVFSSIKSSKVDGRLDCHAPNDSTLVISLKEPFPAFLGLLSMPYAFVVPHEGIDFFGKDFSRNPIGTGPFLFKYWKEGEKLILRRNLKYFERDENGNKLPYLEAVNISFIADKQSEFLEFLKGNIDFISGVHSVSRDELLTRGGLLNPKYSSKITMLTGPYLNTEYLAILSDSSMESIASSPLKNKNFRKAIAYGFDRKKMITYLRNNLAYPAKNGFIPFGMPGFTSEIKGYEYNPDLARKHLAAAGYGPGIKIGPISIATTDDYVDIIEFIQHQLGEIGITITVEVLPGAAYREMMANSKLTTFRASWVADYADAENYLSLFTSHNFSPAGPNYTHFTNKTFDELYQRALTIPDDSVRYLYYQQMDSIIMEELPVIPLYYDKVVRFVGKDVTGIGINPMNLLVLKRVKKE